jgi:hypothetical protein
MSRRREANRAEAIVKGVGAIILLLLLFITIQVLPGILKGKEPQEMMDTGMKLIFVFAFLAILVGVIALVVWVKIVKGKKRDNSDRGTRFE